MYFKRGNLEFDWDFFRKPKIQNVRIHGNDLGTEIANILKKQSKLQGYPHSLYRKYFFDRKIEVICHDVFGAIKIIKQIDGDDLLSAYLATFLFEKFAKYWQNGLLKYGFLNTGVSFWQELVSITLEWERKTDTTIHKGTPLFFLAYNCIQNGDRDNGFTYLYNAIEDDKKLPKLKYPSNAPAYLTSIMSDKPSNYMYPMVSDRRLFLSKMLSDFNKEFPKMTLKEFDEKFTYNYQITNIVSFFVYNFHFIYDLNKNTNKQLLQNEFSRLRILNLFFNFGLIIDNVITNAVKNHGKKVGKMGEAVSWWVENYTHLTQNQLERIIGNRGYKIRDKSPDEILPILLSNIRNHQSPIPKEVYIMIIALKLRNHGGHNLDQQKILSEEYEELLYRLFCALFLAIKSQ